jgi:Xaa-Pro aminopeptidase
MFESHFQSFATLGDAKGGAARAEALRQELQRRDLAGFVVPRADEHQNEYVPACAERLLWLTGFSGSAGLAIVLMDKAAIFVDGRYTLQAPEQVDAKVFTPTHLIDEPPTGWIEKHLPKGGRLGYDPWLQTPDSVERFALACKNAGGEFVAVESNPVDAVWTDRPAAPLGAVSRHKPSLSGESARAKIARVRAALKSADGLAISDAHDVAWLFNIRGADVAHTPLPLSFAIAPVEGRPTLYVDGRKLSNSVRDYLSELADVSEPDRLVGDIEQWGASGKRLAFDAATAPARLSQALQAAGGRADVGVDPIAVMKAVKNEVELEGARAAQLRDGVAVARFLAWFDRAAPKGGDCRGAGAGDLPARHRRLEGHSVSHHFRRRRQFRDPSLPGERGDQSENRPRHLSGRQRRAI